jgi:hypothetical protein
MTSFFKEGKVSGVNENQHRRPRKADLKHRGLICRLGLLVAAAAAETATGGVGKIEAAATAVVYS